MLVTVGNYVILGCTLSLCNFWLEVAVASTHICQATVPATAGVPLFSLEGSKSTLGRNEMVVQAK